MKKEKTRNIWSEAGCSGEILNIEQEQTESASEDRYLWGEDMQARSQQTLPNVGAWVVGLGSQKSNLFSRAGVLNI